MQFPTHPGAAQQTSLFPVAPALPELPAPATPAYVQPPEQLHLWPEPEWVHLTQFTSDVVPDALPHGNSNCVPTSTAIALRMVGLDVPGFHGEDTQAVISGARMIATGKLEHQDGMWLEDNMRAMRQAGATVRPTHSADDMLAAVRSGQVAVVAGNANQDNTWYGAWNSPNTPKSDVQGHAITVSRYNAARDTYTVNDPEFEAPIYATKEELRSFMDPRHMSYGGHASAVIVDGPANSVRKGISITLPPERAESGNY